MTEAAAPGPALRLQGLTQVFGPHPQRALDLLQRGMPLQDIRARTGHTVALNNVNLDLPGGQISVVMGLSGSGKSTLLRHINRLVEPTRGRVWCADTEVTALDDAGLQQLRRNTMAMVFQRYALFPHRTVLHNVAYAAQVRGVPAQQAHRQARQWIERVGLAGQDNSWPASLSGGMQQRVGLARALASNAPVLLMDEAFSALDPVLRVEMQTLLLELQSELRKTVVFITHDLQEALRLGDQVVILYDGCVLQHGDPTQIVLQPANEHVRRFVRDIDRGRALRCGALVVPGPWVDGPLLPDHASVQDAVRALRSAGATRANVCNANGQTLGVVTLDQLLACWAG